MIAGMRQRDLLEARSAAAITLRNFDTHLRRLGVPKLVGRVAAERRQLVQNLSSLGGKPWPYSKLKDNSWVVG